jgi:hypothetical protein
MGIAVVHLGFPINGSSENVIGDGGYYLDSLPIGESLTRAKRFDESRCRLNSAVKFRAFLAPRAKNHGS